MSAPSAVSAFLEATLRPLLGRAGEVLKEGLEATQVKVFQHQGEVVLGPAQVDYTERREAAKEVLRLNGCYPKESDVTVSGDHMTVVLHGLNGERV